VPQVKAGIFLVALAVAFSVAMCACSAEDVIDVTTGESPQETAERTCKEQMWNCQRVYQFETPAENPLGLIELCVHENDRARAEAEYGASQWTTHMRFQSYYLLGVEPICIWQCDYAPGPGFGCNAYSGCYCPGVL
jgi:hypothetical protein